MLLLLVLVRCNGPLIGVVRVGSVAKGLLIKAAMDLDLVLVCREKPTNNLLLTICTNLQLQMKVSKHYSEDSHYHKPLVTLKLG